MADPTVRVELGFRGGGMIAVRVPAKEADALEQALSARDDAVVELSSEDGRYLVVVLHVLYVKRLVREERVGFANA